MEEPFTEETLTLNVIARMHSDFSTKFGVPRQAGLVGLRSNIVFEPAYRDPEALRGLDEFTHLWLLWGFHQNRRGQNTGQTSHWSPTVRPPRLGGNTRKGVFATRSPFRPNPLALSCVKLENIVQGGVDGVVLTVSGADLTDGTPIYDIKPYLPYADCHPEASAGFAERPVPALSVVLPESLSEKLPEPQRAGLVQALSWDPRPPYQRDPDRIYGMEFAGTEVKFRVTGDILTILDIKEKK